MVAHMDDIDCCDICGDQGVLEAIVICSQCKVSREHAYCMRICRINPSEDWCCENCEHSNILVPKSAVMEDLSKVSSSNPSKKLQHNLAQPNKDLDLKRKSSMEKKIQTGKVKPLSSEEVIMLNSGSNISESAVRFSARPNSALNKSKTSNLEKTPLKTRAIQPNISPTLIRANPRFGPLKQMNPSTLGPRNSQLNAAQAPRLQFVKEPTATEMVASKFVPRKVALQPSAKEHQQEKVALQPSAKDRQQEKVALQPSAKGRQQEKTASKCIASTKLAASTLEKNTLRAPRGSLTKDGQLPLNSGNAASRNPELQTDHPGASTRSNRSSVNQCPYDTLPRHFWKGGFRVMDGPKFEEYKIQAHPPCKIHRKVSEFSKKLPDVLNFELINRKDIWAKLFPDYLPDEKNIGLYFLPSNGKSYISMLEHIHAKDAGLRMVMDGTELLVFTSKVLCPDCQRWKGDYFLWGLFYHAKEVKAAGPLDNDQFEVDMEIDMVGGLDVGITDVVITKTPMPPQQLPPAPTSMNGMFDNIPPGFERMHKLGVGTPPAIKNSGRVTQVKVEPSDWIRYKLSVGTLPAEKNSGSVTQVKVEPPDWTR